LETTARRSTPAPMRSSVPGPRTLSSHWHGQTRCSPPGGGGGARYPEPRLAEGANRRKLFFLHPQRMEPVLDSCAADVSARIVRMVETLRAWYKWTAEWSNPLFRTQSSGAWGPRGSDMPAAPHSRTRLEPMSTFTSGPPGGASKRRRELLHRQRRRHWRGGRRIASRPCVQPYTWCSSRT